VFLPADGGGAMVVAGPVVLSLMPMPAVVVIVVSPSRTDATR
jgi:hypothetical protein